MLAARYRDGLPGSQLPQSNLCVRELLRAAGETEAGRDYKKEVSSSIMATS
jgi:hypothetical protein